MNPFIFKNGIWNFKCPEGGKMICYLKENCRAILCETMASFFFLFQKRLYWGIIHMQKKKVSILSVWLDVIWQLCTFLSLPPNQHIERTFTFTKSSSVPLWGVLFLIEYILEYFKIQHSQNHSIILCLFESSSHLHCQTTDRLFCHYRLVLPVLEHYVSGII